MNNEEKERVEMSSDNNVLDFHIIKDVSLFNFEPQPDITAYELALIAKKIKFQINKDIVDRLPEETKRHFQRFVNVKKVEEELKENG